MAILDYMISEDRAIRGNNKSSGKENKERKFRESSTYNTYRMQEKGRKWASRLHNGYVGMYCRARTKCINFEQQNKEDALSHDSTHPESIWNIKEKKYTSNISKIKPSKPL